MRLSVLDPADFRYLVDGDGCYHYGEYTAGGGYGASNTNQQIHNLKKSPNVPAAQLRYKNQAVAYWGNVILTSAGLNLEVCSRSVTFVPIPCSKPRGHPEHDDRMLQVMNYVAARTPGGLDVRPLLVQAVERDAQHHGGRCSPADLAQTLRVDPAQLQVPLRPTVIIVDDVITRGASYAAAKQLIANLDGVQFVNGMFLAKTVHPAIEWPDDLDGAL